MVCFRGQILVPADTLEVRTQPAYIVLHLHHHRCLLREEQETCLKNMQSHVLRDQIQMHLCTLRHPASLQMHVCGMSRSSSRHIRRACSWHHRVDEISRRPIDERSCCCIIVAQRKLLTDSLKFQLSSSWHLMATQLFSVDPEAEACTVRQARSCVPFGSCFRIGDRPFREVISRSGGGWRRIWRYRGYV